MKQTLTAKNDSSTRSNVRPRCAITSLVPPPDMSGERGEMGWTVPRLVWHARLRKLKSQAALFQGLRHWSGAEILTNRSPSRLASCRLLFSANSSYPMPVIQPPNTSPASMDDCLRVHSSCRPADLGLRGSLAFPARPCPSADGPVCPVFRSAVRAASLPSPRDGLKWRSSNLATVSGPISLPPALRMAKSVQRCRGTLLVLALLELSSRLHIEAVSFCDVSWQP